MTSSSRILTIPMPSLRMAWQLLLGFYAAGCPLPAHAQSPPPQNAPVVEMTGNSCLLRIVASTPGRTYFVKMSTDLVHWDWLPWIDVGAGNDIGPVVNLTDTSRSYFTLVYTDDPSSDLDQDGISNIDEILTTFTSPVDADTDLDGMPDGWELAHGLDPNLNDGEYDPDDDGISNREEYAGNTNPHQQDGITDYTLFSRADSVGVDYARNQDPGLKAGMPWFHTLRRYRMTIVRVPYVGKVEIPEVIFTEIVNGPPVYNMLDTLVTPSSERFFPDMVSHYGLGLEVSARATSRPSDVEGEGYLSARTAWLRAPARPVPWSLPYRTERSGNRTILTPEPSETRFYGPEIQTGAFTFQANAIWSSPVTLVAKLDTPGPHELIRPQGGGSSAGETSTTTLTAILLPIEFVVKHTEIDPTTGQVVNPGAHTMLRDEIVDIRVQIQPLGTTDWTVDLTVEPEAMRNENLPNRGNVQMYDFGQVETNGTVTPDKTQFILQASAGGETTIKAVFNKAGTVKIRLKSTDGKIDFTSPEYTIEERIRKYAIPYPGFPNHDPNQYDQEFIDGAKHWGGILQPPNRHG